MSKPPASRGFTLAERRSLQVEKTAMVATIGVAFVAALISFFHLAWLGRALGLEGWQAYLVPLAIDGLAIACTMGIIVARHSKAAGDTSKAGAGTEWVGLAVMLGFSMLGNIYYSIEHRSPFVPVWIAVIFGGIIPLMVAWGVHVYGRAIERGMSAHVLADDPGVLQLNIAHVGDSTAVARKTATRKTTQTRTAPPVPVQTVHAPSAQETVAAARTEPVQVRADQDQPATKEEAIEQINAVVAEHMDATGDTPRGLGTELHDRLGMDRFIRSVSQTRRYVQTAKAAWEAERTTDPLTDAHTEPLRASA